MSLTPDQRNTLRTDIIAKQLPGQPLAGVTDDSAIAAWYNAPSTTWVWRSEVTRAEIYHTKSAENTTWDWDIYQGMQVQQQNAWTQIFMGDRANFGLENLRLGIDKIFKAANAANGTHAKAVSKRLARRIGALFATGGLGTPTSPSTLVFEGEVSPQLISDVLGGRT